MKHRHLGRDGLAAAMTDEPALRIDAHGLRRVIDRGLGSIDVDIDDASRGRRTTGHHNSASRGRSRFGNILFPHFFFLFLGLVRAALLRRPRRIGSGAPRRVGGHGGRPAARRLVSSSLRKEGKEESLC